jgi:hypothetical protein
MNPRFTRLWARILVWQGLVFVAGGALLASVALIIDMPWGSITGQAVVERALVAAFLLVSGVLAGAPLIVLGQLVLLFIDQRRLLGRMARRLGRWERAWSHSVGSRSDTMRA